MAHSGKTMTFATDLVPQEDNIYSLGTDDLKWIIRGSLPLSDITGADDLKAIEGLSGTNGLLKKTAANTWTLDTNSYVTSSGITSVTISATSPVQSSTSTAQSGSSASTTISLKDAYGDTKNPYGSKTKSYVLAAPSNANGAPSFRALVAADISDLSQKYLKLDGSNNMTADVNIIAGDTDKFINFWYNTNKTAGASWRMGMLGSGSGNTNYFVIQSGTSTTSATTWNNALKIGQNNYDIYNNENRIPNTGNATGSVGGTTTPVYVDAGVIKAGTALKDLAYIAKPTSNTTTTFLRGDGTWQTVLTSHQSLAAYAPLASPALTGTPTAPTAANGTSSTQIATTEFVNNTLSYVNAMRFKGTLGTGGTVTALPASHEAGDTYRVITAGTWAGKYCEVGTLIICIKDSTTAADADWTTVETNEDGAIVGSTPSSSTDNAIVRWDGAAGRTVQNSTVTISDNGNVYTERAGEVGYVAKNTTKAHQVEFIVGDSGNGGIYDRTKAKWIVYSDTSGNVFLNGNANTATSAGKWTTARTLTIGSTGKSVDGSGNVSWSLADIGAAASSHTHNESDITWSNGTLYTIGDDIYIGDINQAGHLGLKSKQAGNTGLAFIKQATANDTAISAPSGTTIGKITWDGTKFSITSTTAIAGTITNATNATSATNATALYTASAANTAEDGQDARIKAAIKSYFDNNTASVPRGKTISLSISTGHGVQATGYFLSGYDSNPYGGFFISHYDTPRYVGISNGNYSCYELVRNNGSTYSINVSGTAGGVAWTNVSGRPTKLSQFTNDSGYITSYTETDPTVPAWAKASSKPSYTASEVGAAPASTVSCTTANVKSALGTGSDTTKFLNNKGEWAVPSYTTSLAWSAITSKPNLSTGNARIFYGTSSTAAGTAAKVVTCSIYDAYTAGDILVVKFDNANSASSPTLNVNSKGAKNIRKIYNGAVNTLNANSEITGTCMFVYDGTQWLLTNTDYNNTYTIPTSFTITANATDGLWDLTGTNGTNAVTYALAPYSSKGTTATFYTAATNPTLTTRLNYDGYLYATKLYSGGTEVSVSGHTHSYLSSISWSGDTNLKLKQSVNGAAATDVLQFAAGSNITLTGASGKLTIAGTPDTKNTAGSTNSDSKLYLIGATSQAANPQTYSDAHVFETNGAFSAKTLGVNADTDNDKVTLQWNATDSSLDFVFA